MPRATIKRIHVNRNAIKANVNNIAKDSVFNVLNRRRIYIADVVEIDGPSKLIYSPNDPLCTNAKVWIETTAPVKIARKKMSGFDFEVLI